MTSRALGNGLTQAYDYYDWNEQVNGFGQGGRLQNLTTGSLQNLTYTYDPVGNISQISNPIASETSIYGYDELNRLTSWNLNGATENYTYNPATGNLATKADVTLTYNDAAHVHAVTSAGSNTYSYDANGNQTTRIIGSDTYTLLYDAENRLVEVKKNSVTMATFVYDGDGRRVKSVMDGETTYFVGAHYELTGSTVTKYYFAGAARIAMRKYTIPQSMSVEYLLGDHLGSTNLTTDANGTKVSELRYKPWGEIRYTWTSAPATTPAYQLPSYTFTGQYSHMDDPSTAAVTEGFGL
jgi:YD repeat-containing protein